MTEFKNVVILSGAGVSTNSGIPDYRSEDGVFAKLSSRFPDITPEKVFSEEYFPKVKKTPEYRKLIQQITTAKPTTSHKLAKWLHDSKNLKRVYTQNIDGLYQKAGVPDDKIVEFHGSFAKDNVVLYGQPIHKSSLDMMKKDFVDQVADIDLVLVMGTSLQVFPFCVAPNMVRKQCTRVLVDRNPENCYTNQFSVNSGYDSMMYYQPTSPIKLFGREVNPRPMWSFRGKWKKQYVYEEDCDVWSKKFIAECDRNE